MLKLGIDIRWLGGRRTGVGSYTERLLSLLPEMEREYTVSLYTDFREERLREAYGERLAVIENVQTPLKRVIWEQVKLPLKLFMDGINLYHSVNYGIPAVRGCRLITTIHDLSAVIYPEYHADELKEYSRLNIKHSVSESDALIAVSGATKDSIMDLYGIPGERIRVIYEKPSPLFLRECSPGETRLALAEAGIDGPYVLFVGTLEPRKNVNTILKAFAAVKGELPGDAKLVLAGRAGWKYQGIFGAIRELGLTEKVIWLQYVPDRLLPFLYSGCSLFMYPSFFEGFGLPPLEAVYQGAPVLCSDIPVFRELYGEKMNYFKPLDYERAASVMAACLSSQAEGRKLAACQEGLREKFMSYDAGAPLLDLYREVVCK